MPLLAVAALLAVVAALVYKKANQYPKGYFGNPLGIPVELAANFGEVRSNHFHMGLDIRTNGRENLPIYAAANGFISRITIEEAGFGRALFITHPNGTTSVYGHLSRFSPAIEAYVRARQYTTEHWEQDILLDAARFPVKQGMLVAYSGNTGTSEGPHLHFEIRDTRTGNNLNPLLNGFGLKDDLPPVIRGLYWYNRVKSIYETDAVPIALRGEDNIYTGADSVTYVTSPRISLGIEATDKNAASKYRLGIYKAMEYMDDSLVYCFALNGFCYNDTRYVNACIDYGKWFQQSKSIQLLCTLPGNKLPVFMGSPGTGVLHIEDKKVHPIKMLVFDAVGNRAVIKLSIKYAAPSQLASGHGKHGWKMLPGKCNIANTAHADVNFGCNAFYDTVLLSMYEEATNEANSASVLIHLHNAAVPVHDCYELGIQTTLATASPLRNHVIMQLTNDKHAIVTKGQWQGNMMKGRFSELGNIQLVIDTVPPELSFEEGDNAHFTDADNALHIQYKDNVGGAAFFKGAIDGRWALFEKKGDVFTYRFDEHCPPGKHDLQCTVADLAGNITSKNFVFYTNGHF